MKTPLKPSGPRALSIGMILMSLSISVFRKGDTSPFRSVSGKLGIRELKSKTILASF
jgi:hypothetical protein